jgi:hypothetical protein
MAKNKNGVGSRTIRVTVSAQSEQLLEQLVQRGVFGRSPAEVAGRFVDRALQRFIPQPKLKISLTPKSRKDRRKEEN